jgi:hypothetical protein
VQVCNILHVPGMRCLDKLYMCEGYIDELGDIEGSKFHARYGGISTCMYILHVPINRTSFYPLRFVRIFIRRYTCSSIT